MSFGFGIGDILIVSTTLHRVYKTIRDAPEEQDTFCLDLETFRQLVLSISVDLTPGSSPQNVNSAGQQQLLRCLKLLEDLDEIAAMYMGTGLSHQTTVVKKRSRTRDARWALYKREKFVELLDDLRGRLELLKSLQQLGNSIKSQTITLPNFDSPVRLIDALDRVQTCSFHQCDTWEVCHYRLV